MEEIRVGSAVVTLVDLHKGREESYNRWYERDHFFAAVMLGPGALSGGRFVATRAEKEHRRVGGIEGRDDVGTLLAVYWLQGDGEGHRTWSQENVKQLKAAGRMSTDRDLVWGFRCAFAWAEERDTGGVPALLALEHAFDRVGTLMVEVTPGASPQELAAGYRIFARERLLSPASPVAICVALLPETVPDPMGTQAQGPTQSTPDRVLFLWFVEGEAGNQVDALIDEHESSLARSGLGRPVWSSTFRSTVVGSDTYMDQLWLDEETAS